MPRQPGFMRRFGKRLGKGLLLLPLFVLLLVAATFAAINARPTQSLVLDKINGVLAGQFKGKLRIESIGHFGLFGIQRAHVRVFAPNGKEVLELEGATIDLNLPRLALAAVRGTTPLPIALDRIDVRHAVVFLENDDTKTLGLVRAFEPRTPSPSDPNSVAPTVTIPIITLQHAWIHGQLGQTMDSEIKGLSGSFQFDAGGTKLGLKHAELLVRAMPAGANPRGVVKADLSVPSAENAPLGVSATFKGDVAGVPLSAAVTMKGSRIDARAEIPRTPPERFRKLLPDAPIHEPASALVLARGTLPKLDISAKVHAGAGVASVRGALVLEPSLSLHTDLELEHIDARTFAPTAPKTDVTTRGTVQLEQPTPGAISGRFDLAMDSANVDGTLVPATALRGRFTAESIAADITLLDAGARVELQAALVGASEKSRQAEFEATIKVPELARMPMVKGVRGSLDAAARGRYDLTKSSLDVTADARVRALRAASVAVERIDLEARVTGTADAPSVTAAVRAEDAILGSEGFERVDVRAAGPLTALRVSTDVVGSRGLTLGASASVDAKRTHVQNLDLEVARDGTALKASAKSLRAQGGSIAFDDLRVSGAGELAASGVIAPSRVQVRAKAERLDLAKVGDVAGLAGLVKSGTLSLEADLDGSPRSLRGSFNANLSELSALNVSRASARADLEFAGREVNGELSVALGNVGKLDLQARKLRFAEGGLARTSIHDVKGDLAIDADLSLADVVAALPEDSRPVDRARGRLALRGALALTGQGLPSLTLNARTSALEVTGKASPAPITNRKAAKAEQPLRLKEIDLNLDLSVDGSSGSSAVHLEAFDRRGQLVSIGARATLPENVISMQPSELQALALRLPMDTAIRVARRDLAELPIVLRPAGVLGGVEGELRARGTARDPELDFAFRGHGLRSKDPSFPLRFEVRADASYRNRRAEVAIDAHRGRKLALSVRSNLDGDLFELAAQKKLSTAPRGAVHVELASFPLQTIPQLKERMVGGELSGKLDLEQLGQDATLAAEARVRGLDLGGIRYDEARATLTMKDRTVEAEAQVAQRGGFLKAKVSSSVDWGKKLVPVFDAKAARKAELKAQQFRIDGARAFVAKQVSALEGLLDADLVVNAESGQTSVTGAAKLRRGLVQVPAIGRELRGIRADVTASQGGVIKVENIEARGRQGRVRAAVVARLQGLALRAANANIVIAEKEALPLTAGGVELGTASGAIDVDMQTSADGKDTTLSANVRKFHLSLPELSQNQVQALDEPENVRVGVRLDKKSFQTLPLQPIDEPSEPGESRMTVKVDLGQDVWIEKGHTMRVRLGGNVQIVTAPTLAISGRVRLAGGRIDVSGKLFRLERGIITFQESDPANPIVIATARYDAPGYRVYADFVGPVKTGTLKLHSEPPLTEDQIFNVLLFGTTDGSRSSSGSGTAALSVGGGAATQGLNAALGDLTDLDVSTRIDTSRGSPTPELVFQLTRRVSAQIGYNLNPTPGQAPDRTFLTLEFRIRRRWSLDTTVGDRGGTMIDAVWRHHY